MVQGKVDSSSNNKIRNNKITKLRIINYLITELNKWLEIIENLEEIKMNLINN